MLGAWTVGKHSGLALPTPLFQGALRRLGHVGQVVKLGIDMLDLLVVTGFEDLLAGLC